jgi:hypothetical protein
VADSYFIPSAETPRGGRYLAGPATAVPWDKRFQHGGPPSALARPVHGEWLLLDAATQLGPDGSGLARSTLSDARGVVGSGRQTLVLSPR